MVRPPQSRMDILTESEMDAIVAQSRIREKYNKVIDSVSAHELLSEKLEDAARRAEEEEEKTSKEKKGKDKSILDDPVVRSMTRTAGNALVRTLLGVLGLGGRSSRRKRIF